jgi:hypothetical protein
MDFTEEELEEAALRSAMNMGPAQDVWHPDYGWILRDSKITEAGKKFLEEQG